MDLIFNTKVDYSPLEEAKNVAIILQLEYRLPFDITIYLALNKMNHDAMYGIH